MVWPARRGSDVDSVVQQKIRLKTDDYTKALRRATDAIREFSRGASDALLYNSKAVEQNESQMRKWGRAVGETTKKAGQEFRANLATGAKALTLGLAADAIKHAADDTVSLALDASKAFADLKSRVGASDETLAKWRDRIQDAAVSTKANVATMVTAFSDLSDSVDDPSKITDFMEQIGGASVLTGGDGKAVTGYLKNVLTGQGKAMSASTVDEALTGADLLRRRGRGFGTLSGSMEALGSLDQQSVKQSGLSEREIAAIVAGASKTGVSGTKALAGVSALLSANSNGLEQGSVLAGILGIHGKGGLSKDGKLDLSRLGNAGTYQRLMNLGGGDEKKSMEIFRKISGQSAEASDAIFMMIKNFKDYDRTVQEANADHKKFAQSAEEAADNLKDAYQGLQTRMIKGFSDMFGGFEKPLSALMNGRVGAALGGMPGAFGQLAGGVAKHPGLAIAGIGATAAGGALLRSLFTKGGLPVFVTNQSDGGAGSLTTLGKAFGAAGKTAKFLGKWGGLIGTGVNLAVDGYETYQDYHAAQNDQERSHALKKGGAGAAGTLIGGAIGGALGSIVPGAGTAIGAAAGATLGNWAAQKIVVEIDSRDPMFSARPKATNQPRDARY